MGIKNNMKNIDNIFENNTYNDGFKFDRQVASVFENMISRSVPGYENVITMCGILGGNFVKDNSNCYDLGCSLGATSIALQKNITAKNCKIFAVDNSEAMIERARAMQQMLPEYPAKIDLICDDIQNINFQNNALTAINFTLQFLKVDERQDILQKIYDSMQPNGILILSEKIKFDDHDKNQFFIDIYHQWKGSNGYSTREIVRKREALENVLIPDTIETHQKRLENIGFKNFAVWFQCFNFVSMVAFK